MLRSAEEILARADELTRRFEGNEPGPGDIQDARALRDVAHAFARLAASERELAEAVAVARAEGHSWAAIGYCRTSGETARQRYGSPQRSHEIGERAARTRAVVNRARVAFEPAGSCLSAGCR